MENKENINNSKIYDVIIVGGGPGGLTAGIYTGRAKCETLIIEQEYQGGLYKAHMIDNYPGFPEGISGKELNLLMKKQAQKFGCQFVSATVLDFHVSGDVKVVKTSAGNYQAHNIIIAAGVNNSSPKIKGESELTGAGVSYCATCDGAFTRGLTVALFGHGDEVAEEALFLTQHAAVVNIYSDIDTLGCDAVLQSNLVSKGANIFTNAKLMEILGTDSVTGAKLDFNGVIQDVACDFAFLYLGTKSTMELYGSYFTMDAKKSIVTDSLMQTSVAGVYAVGDIRNTPIRQVGTAVGDGIIAAMEVVKNKLNQK